MNATDTFPDDSALDEIAAEWLYERDEGFTPDRAKAFADWCSRDPRHAEAVTRVERTLALLNEMPEVRDPLQARLTSTPTAAVPREIARVVRYRPLAWAAGLAAVLILGLGAWWATTSRIPSAEHYATDTTAQRSLALPDGSVMDINVGSDVSVRFTAKERRVTLTQGEAHFQVAHDTTRPFIVTAGNVSVRAVGTAFDVQIRSETVNVVVVEGKVEFAQESKSRMTEPVVVPPLLHAGERVQMSRIDQAAPPKIDKMDTPSIRALLTWQNPLTSFTDVPLRDVVARFNRRNATQLVLKDAALGDRKIGGMIALDQVDAFVRLLEQDGDIIADRQSAGEIGLRRAH